MERVLIYVLISFCAWIGLYFCLPGMRKVLNNIEWNKGKRIDTIYFGKTKINCNRLYIL